MSRLKIKKVEDRLTVAKILIDNDYTVRQVKQKRGKGNSYDYMIEYWPNNSISPDVVIAEDAKICLYSEKEESRNEG